MRTCTLLRFGWLGCAQQTMVTLPLHILRCVLPYTLYILLFYPIMLPIVFPTFRARAGLLLCKLTRVRLLAFAPPQRPAPDLSLPLHLLLWFFYYHGWFGGSLPYLYSVLHFTVSTYFRLQRAPVAHYFLLLL